MIEVCFHERTATDTVPAGITVTRKAELPDGDFRITEYKWPRAVLWFSDDDRFTADEREAAYRAYLCTEGQRIRRYEAGLLNIKEGLTK